MFITYLQISFQIQIFLPLWIYVIELPFIKLQSPFLHSCTCTNKNFYMPKDLDLHKVTLAFD